MFRTIRRPFRSLAAAAAVGGLLLAVSACGSDPSDDAKAPTGATTPAATAGASSSDFPLTLQDSLGSVRIPAAPQRVVVLSSVDLDAALAAGVVPVLAPKNVFTADGTYPWLQGRLTKDTELVSTISALPFERIAALQPDLILDTGDYTAKDNYAKLSQIAPTVAPLTSAATDSWQDRQRLVGKALGRQAESDRAVRQAQDAVTAAKATYPGLAGKTFSVTYAAAVDQIVTLSSPHDFAVGFLQSLGLRQAPALTELAKNSVGVGTVSQERLDVLSADLMISAYQTPDLEKKVGESALMRSAATGHTFQVVDLTTITLLRNPSTLGLPWVLDRLAPALAKAAG
ncbi:ABC transporter substrate-binding protein [Actinacidiphila sp. ITFR-21]|uniref:ABC transporter substrate-binding protein n=1 Tax=Actinacidiphila sp. ITFR-21 TaxID=3075199 RepID=UPI00288B3950|nr:ABC transporter substrate-binding protein [Streptomyces sp. ITFR-21]WNI18932.1 ABC transporter substrate-binding protein [Streptomyces sp. ITFR-21]